MAGGHRLQDAVVGDCWRPGMPGLVGIAVDTCGSWGTWLEFRAGLRGDC